MINPDLVRTLPTPELGLELLRALALGGTPNANNLMRGAEQAYGNRGESDVDWLLSRLSDAWAWLEAHGLLGPATGSTGSNWMRVTGEGREAAADERALDRLWASERLAGDLHPALKRVRVIFNLGDYETAAFAAMKEVEVEVRRLANFSNANIGVALMHSAFKPDGGPLADPAAERGERQAVMNLYAGAIGAFKNPSSHRAVTFDDPIEAAEVVQTADLLLRMLRRTEERLLATKGAE